MERQLLISHFRFWGFTCKSLGWSMKEKRLLGNPDKLGLFARRVWDGAAAIAARLGTVRRRDEVVGLMGSP
jgi:hypothetical protein